MCLDAWLFYVDDFLLSVSLMDLIIKNYWYEINGCYDFRLLRFTAYIKLQQTGKVWIKYQDVLFSFKWISNINL